MSSTSCRRVLACGVLGASLTVASPAAGQDVRVGVDPRVELLGIVCRLAGNPEYNQGRLAAYDSTMEAHFGRYREHPAVARETGVNP